MPSVPETLARDLLALCEMLLAARAPDRSLISPATPVLDCCPLLAVNVAGGRLEATWGSGQLDSFTQGKGPSASSLQLVVTIVRCTPKQDVSGKPPLATDIEAATAETLEDLWTLWQGVGRAIRDGDILSRCQGARFDTITPIAETGGCAGWQIPLTISGPAG